MAIDYTARPTDAKNFTTSTEVNLDQDFQDYSDFLPAVNRTESIQNFFGATVNQLLSSGSTQSIDAYWGRLAGRNYNPDNELFQPEHSATRLNYQFQPGVVSRLAGETQQTTSYINWLNRLESLGADVNNHDRLFSEQGYVLDLPINADMFTNFRNYYWLEGDIPLIDFTPPVSAPIDIDDITKVSQYTTPTSADYKSVEFVSGLRIKFTGPYVSSTSGDYNVNAVYSVENVGGSGGIKLVELVDENGVDVFPNITPYYLTPTAGWDLHSHNPTLANDNYSLNKTYNVMERWASDKNPWARTNSWFSIHALRIAAEYNNLELEVYGNTFTRADRPIVEFNANIELYMSNKSYVEVVEYAITGDQANEMTTGVSTYAIDEFNSVENGDIVLVTSTDTGQSGVYYPDAHIVGGVGSSITLTQHNTYNAGEYVIVGNGAELGYIYCYNGNAWSAGQTKDTRGAAALFELYDDNNTSLSEFANTDFTGDKVFGYTVGMASTYDRELGFKPDFTDAGSFNNYNFEWVLNNTRYSKDVTVVTGEEIRGLYYYHNWVDDGYHNGWSNIRGGQRVPIIQTQVADGVNNIVFELGTNAVSQPTEFTVVETADNSYRWYDHSYIDRTYIGYENPEFIFKYDTEYTFNMLTSTSPRNLEIVDPFGNIDSDITFSTSFDAVKTFSVDSAYKFDTIIYRRADDHSIFGEIHMTDINHNRYSVIKNGQRLVDGVDFTFSGTQITVTADLTPNDVVELSYVADAELTNVVYDVAPVHFYNSENKPFTTAGYDDLVNHFRRQLGALPGFDGDVTGTNNYHKTLRQHTYDGLIRQQIFETKKVHYLLDQEDINPIRALKSFSKDYTDFKQFFKNKVHQLWKTESWNTVQALVDRALSDINIGKNETFKYAHSDMLYYNQGQTQSWPHSTTRLVFPLPQTRNQYGNTQNHVQAWLTEWDAGLNKSVQRPLTVGIDYTIDGQDLTLVTGANLPATLDIHWYDYTQVSNVPYSAVKLGFFKPTQVEVVAGELIGHDGSRHILNGTDLSVLDMDSQDFDVVGAALWDFELRIFNNLVDAHFVNDTMGQDMMDFYPTPAGEFAYTVADMNSRLDDWYNRWAIRNNVTDINTVSYDAGNEFTWNYSTVGANLSSWRSVYVYTFGTDRPDTHPWEMLGHRVKPTWWDNRYSWAAGAKRDALVDALRVGLSGNKYTPFKLDIRYVRPIFTDTADIVSDDGADTLRGPVSAGVTVAPTNANAAQPFKFGDWSEVENTWRKSSEYLFAQAEVYLQLKPYRVHETFWQLGRWAVKYNVTQEQWIDTETCSRTHIDEIHNQTITDGIIGKIDVTDGGDNYSSLELAFPVVNICYQNATATAYIVDNKVSTIAVTNPGRGFENDPAVVFASTPGNADGVELEYTIDFDFTVTRLGFNTLPAEEFTVNSTNTNVLSKTLAGLEVNYMVHVGGYTDKRIMQIEVDGDYTSGLIRIPDSSYDILIDRNAPTKTVFYSGVKIQKVDGQGYKVSGYDMDSQFFNFYQPSTAGAQVTVDIGNVEIIKHNNWRNEVVRVAYNTVLRRRQDLYQFLLGLGKYYESLGFATQPRWETEAYEAVAWALDSSDTSDHYVNGIDTTLTYNQGARGVVQTVDINYDGVSNVLDENFKNIRRAELLVLRNNNSTDYSLKAGTDRIYGVGVRVVEFEHIITLENTTAFNDPIYQPELGVGQNRVRLIGERTRNWNGRVEAPGYLVQDSGLMLNIESSIHELETESVTSESKALERLTRQTIGYNVGYSKPTYMTDMFISDNSAYKFEKGVREYKGTATAIQAMTRNKNIFGSSFEHNIYEEWMVRLGDYGDVDGRNPLQFAIDPNKIKSDPQHFRLNNTFTSDKSSDLIIDLHQGSADSISGNYASPFEVYDVLRLDNTSIQDLEQYQTFTRDAGLPLTTEVDYFLGTVDNIGDIYDPTEEYAMIPNWSDTTAYVKGDRVRLGGYVYRLLLGTTGLTDADADVVLRGTQQYPVVVNGQTMVLNGTTITFEKINTTFAFNPIIVDGAASYPEVPSGSSLPLNGITINFIKTSTSTTYGDIILTGNVTNPTIVNSASKVFTVSYENVSGGTLNNVPVAFNELKTTMIQQQIWSEAFATAGVASAINKTNTRISALNTLRNAYIAATDEATWQTFVGDYYDSTVSPTRIVNPEYLGIQVAANTSATWETAARALIQIDLDLLTELGTTHSETELTMVDGRAAFNDASTFDSDIIATNNLLDVGVTANNENENLQNFIDFVEANPGVSIATGRAITVSNPEGYVTDTLSTIASKINTALLAAAAPAEISATTTDNIITLSRTGNTDGYRLGVSTDTALGFTSADNDVETSATTVTSPENLTLAEAVLAINNAAITGVAAQSVNNRMRITCTTEQLAIGGGAAANALGYNSGTLNATTDTTIIPVDLAIGDIITQINTAQIANLSASQIGGAVILTYTGEELIISAGTANTEIGFGAATYDAFTEEKQNAFLETDWEIIQDPAHFNIWSIDNIGSNPSSAPTTTNRYDVLQTLDFNIGVLEICAGNESGQDALIATNTTTTLSAGEYVLIVNSSCIPSVDGIHQVTRTMGTAGFFIDQYIDQKGFTGKVFPLRSVRFPNTSEANLAMLNPIYIQNGLGLRTGNYVYVDERLDDNGVSLAHGAVYSVVRGVLTAGLTLIRNETKKPNNSFIKNGVLYSNSTGKTVINFEVYDPLKGIIPGIAAREIDIRSDFDFAYYNNSTSLAVELQVNNTWGQAQVGKVWWDLSNAIYINYDQGSPEYRQTHWGELFPTASIDVYEWTKSPVTPDDYGRAIATKTIVDGIELSGVVYAITDQFGEQQYNWCEENELNINTNQVETYYYFWVGRKTTTPSVAREYSVLQLAALIGNPDSQQVDWIAASSDNTLLVSSLTRAVSYNDLVMQVNYKNSNSDYHQEFALLAENDPDLVIPEWLHISLRDSLAGFTQDTETLDYLVWNDTDTYTYDNIVLSQTGEYYRNNNISTNNDPDTDTANDFWIPLEFNTNNPDGIYTGVNTVSVNTPQSIPDLDLHPNVRYGLETRPHQTWFVELESARKAVVELINIQLMAINLVDSDIPWRVAFERVFTVGGYTYDITQYWNFFDWTIAGYKFDRTVGDYFVENVTDLADLTPTNNQVAQVECSVDPDGRPRRSAWRFTAGEWILIYKEKATIQFNTLLWGNESSLSGWDTVEWDTVEWDRTASAVMVEIFNSFYTDIWTQEFRGNYAALWFHMVKHVLGEQSEVDWIFKTSYFKLVIEDTLEKQYNKYFTENSDHFFDFVDTIKPFHSKLQDGIVRKLADEELAASVQDTVEIRVQTNPVDSTVDPTNTRSFRLTVGYDQRNQASQIVNSNKVELAQNIGPDDVFVAYKTGGTGTMPAGPGAFWINGERFTYTGIVTLQQGLASGFTSAFSDGFSGARIITGVVRGTHVDGENFGTFARAHFADDIIEYEHALTENTQLTAYSKYTNGLNDNFKPAWNESGEKLLDATNADPNGVSIRSQGYGTI